MKEVTRRIGILAAVLSTASAAWADGTEELNTPDGITVAAGTGVIAGGVGLLMGQPGDIQIDVPAGAIVKQVLLYVEGANFEEEHFSPTMEVTVNGMPVVVSYIGGNTDYGMGHLYTVSYREDITMLGVVQPGPNTVTVGGLDFTRDNDGVGLLVIIDDGGLPSPIDVRDGSDVAFILRPGLLAETVPQTFDFPPAPFDRFGAVDFLVGSVRGSSGNLAAFRPNSFEITTGGVTSVFSDQLDSLDGMLWDTVSLGVTVPAGATDLTIQLFSRDDGVVAPGNLPASLVWVASSFSVETPEETDCWITTGGFQNAGSRNGKKDYTFGGNVGPPPRGSWQVIDHNTGDNFHSNDVHITGCSIVGNGGPGQPGGKKGFKIDRADFAGTGRLNGVDGYPFTGYVEDAGEPSGKKGNNKDVFSITVLDPDTNEVVFEASAPLDGGNVQIHPPTGNQ